MARGHEWKAERIRRDVPFLERARGRLRHRLMGALRELAGAGEAVAYDVAPFAQFVSVAVDALLDTFGQVYPRAARTALEIASGSVRFARRDPQLPDFLRRWYRAEAERHLSRYAAREREVIRRVVQRAYLRGGDAREVAREVSRRILSVAGWQAERIARTELMRFYNLAHYGVYQSLPRGVVVGYEYSVVLDDRTSHVCRNLAGKRVAAHQLRHLPPFHPHCRTVVIPIFAAEQAEEGVAYVDPAELPIPSGWGNIEGLPLPQGVDVLGVGGVRGGFVSGVDSVSGELLVAMEDVRRDFTDEYVELWGRFYEALVREGEVVERAVSLVRGLVERALTEQLPTRELLVAGLSARDRVVNRLWEVLQGRGLVSAEDREAARVMLFAHATNTDTEGAYWLRVLARRFLRSGEVGFYEYPHWLGADVSELSDSHERGFMALHAMSYGVLRRLCGESASPVFGADGTVRVGRVFSVEEWGFGDVRVLDHPQLAVQSSGSSAYRIFTTYSGSFGHGLSRLGVARVPIRRVLATFATAVELPMHESEYVLMGGARWSRVFMRGVEDVAVVERLRGLTWEGVERVRRELMRLWDSSRDEDFVGALREMLEAIVGDLE
jgi:SPP1 gp7 family putative phage head morphogenesis protein